MCTTWFVQGKDYYLVDVLRERLRYPDLKKRVVSHTRKFNADVVLIEDTASGTQLLQDFRTEGAMRPIGIKPEGDKTTRMSAQSAKIEAGQVLLPESAPWLEDFKTELLQFPNGKYDDQVDSMSQYLGWQSQRDSTLFDVDWGNDDPEAPTFPLPGDYGWPL